MRCGSRDLLLVDTTSLVSTVLTTTVVCTLCLPLMFALKTCVREVEVLIGFIENEEEIAALSESIVSSSAYFHASSISKSIGWELPNTFDATMLKEHLTRVGAIVKGNLKDFSVSLLGIVAKTGSMLVSFTTFSTACSTFFRAKDHGEDSSPASRPYPRKITRKCTDL